MALTHEEMIANGLRFMQEHAENEILHTPIPAETMKRYRRTAQERGGAQADTDLVIHALARALGALATASAQDIQDVIDNVRRGMGRTY